MTVLAELLVLLRLRDFRRLLFTRLVSQAGDGALEIGLASLLFFSPERATTAPAIAAAFTVAIAPYTLIGPFAGVLLDRWRRRQVLLGVNLIRATLIATVAALVLNGQVGWPLYLLVLLSMSLNRFYLAALGASLPHVVPPAELVLANAITPTSGTVAALGGAALATGTRLWLGAADRTDALILLVTVGCYLAAAALARRMAPDLLGPDGVLDPDTDHVPPPGLLGAARGVVDDFRAGARHLRGRRPALHALVVIGALRFGYGVLAMCTVLLCRNTFANPADPDAGAARIAAVAVATGLGLVAAAVLTPFAVHRVSLQAWIAGCATAAGVTALAFAVLTVAGSAAGGPAYPMLLLAGFAVGLTVQSAKICVDAVVQGGVADEARGRVMAFYDLSFNIAFLAAAGLCALLLPPSGRSVPVVLGAAAVWFGAAVGYTAATRRRRPAASKLR